MGMFINQMVRLPEGAVAACEFDQLAVEHGITGSAMSLILQGHLTRFQVGKRSCFAWWELLPLMAGIPPVLAHRADLAKQGHTITVERLTHHAPSGGGWAVDLGGVCVVERHDGDLWKVMRGSWDGDHASAAAATARTYGCRYVPHPSTDPGPDALDCAQAHLAVA
jgi:hypothetical protein